MRTIFTLLCLTLLTLPSPAQPTPPKNVIKLSFDGFFFGRYQASYERIVGKYTSVQVTLGGIIDISKSENTAGSLSNNENRTTGFVASPEFRVYLSEFTKTEVPSGFYFGTSIRYRNVKNFEAREDDFSSYEFNEHERNIGLGVVAGVQYVTSFGLGFDAFIGPEFKYVFLDSETTDISTNQDIPDFIQKSSTIRQDALPFAGLNISYAF
ncbi:MAG: hypothetical protein GC193_08545 [Cryomorphaceae bacterium]|nr:hypothetical protein [Cryomorphaceae bacterium]